MGVGVYNLANYTAIYEETYSTESPILFCNVFFVSKGNLLDFYFTLLQLVLSAVWRP